MRILVIFSNPTCLNLGDVAMLQVAVQRLKSLWPEAEVGVMVSNAEALRRHCPDAVAVPFQDEWLGDKFFFGRLMRVLPATLVSALVRSQACAWRRWPGTLARATVRKMRLRRQEESARCEWFFRSLSEADLVVACGAGGLNDRFRTYASTLLVTLGAAQSWGKKTAMSSHGFGPISRSELMSRAGVILRRVSLICVREKLLGVPLLARMGVPEERIVITGDDAIEIAFTTGSETSGQELGINVRTGGSSEVEGASLQRLGRILRVFAREQAASCVPLPIALQQELDASCIRTVLDGYPSIADSWRPQTPAEVIKWAGRCRAVVTSAYHAAVFALSQGVPTVCLHGSDYFKAKFRGLADQFGKGLWLVPVSDEGISTELPRAMREAWSAAPEVRGSLLQAARHQIEESRQGYQRLKASTSV
jgi:colanic acid/amylovoran biosynthesis protein